MENGAWNRFYKIAHWLGSHERAVWLSLLVVLGGIWLFAELADEVMDGDTHVFDERVLKSLRQPDNPEQPIGPPWLKNTAQDVTALGGTAVLAMAVAAVSGFLLLAGRYHMLVSILIASGGGVALSLIMKASFSRPRPSVVPALTHFHTASFPSGHSMMSAVVYLTLGVLLASILHQKALRFYIFTLAGTLTCLIGLSRVFLGAHYPTDVLAGWTIGLVWAVFCRLVVRTLQRKTTVLDEPALDSPAPVKN